MKLAFYYSNIGLSGFDYSNPCEYNPGIGGTHYQMVQLIYYLNLLNFDISVYCNEDSIFPLGCRKFIVNSYSDLVSVIEHDVDFLIMRAESDCEAWPYLSKCPVRIIFWGHNYYLSPLADYVANTDTIVANVFVGKQQYDRYIDHDVIMKSTVIYNMQNHNDFQGNAIREKSVVYMGALIPSKGFLELAKIWKSILKAVPDAKLKVIGTGQVYSRNERMGALGLATQEYERKFLRYLTDDCGKVLDSVEFLGLLGKEKYDVFATATVGVVNPTARTEIFSVSIMEMATAKLPVVTLNKNGFPDSIRNAETGFLCGNTNEIKEKIVYLLQHPDVADKMGNNAKIFVNSFSPSIIIPRWVSLFETIINEKKIQYLSPSRPYLNNLKILRILNRFIRNNLKLSFCFPIIKVESVLFGLFRRF